mgnify:CR=1 FL=1
MGEIAYATVGELPARQWICRARRATPEHVLRWMCMVHRSLAGGW